MNANGASGIRKSESDSDGFILTKHTFNRLLPHKMAADMIALLCFYSHTALWQASNQPYATIGFVAKGLHWGRDKVRAVRRELKALGFIQDVPGRDEHGRATKWFVRLSFFHPTGFQEGGDIHPPDFTTDGKNPLVVKPVGKCSIANKKKCLEANNKKQRTFNSSDVEQLSEPINTPECKAAWNEWKEYRRQRRNPLTPATIKKQLVFLQALGPDGMVVAINQSIQQGWSGLFEPKRGVTRNAGSTPKVLTNEDYEREADSQDHSPSNNNNNHMHENDEHRT